MKRLEDPRKCKRCKRSKYMFDFRVLGKNRVDPICRDCRAEISYNKNHAERDLDHRYSKLEAEFFDFETD